MMALWQTRTQIFPFITIHIVLLFPQASFGVEVKCWWHQVLSVGPNLSIECQEDPPGSMQDLCLMDKLSLNQAVNVLRTGCNHTKASFSALIDAKKMQAVDCMLLCPGHTTLPCKVQEGYPPPTCLIPFNDEERNIHCHWTVSRNLLIPTNFTLHWREDVENGYSGYIDVGENDSAVIPRATYTAYEDISVWVSATNALGKIDSETLLTNTHSIIQSYTFINSHSFEPLEIFWVVSDNADYSGMWECNVQYKKQCDKCWTEPEDIFQVSFALGDAVPFTMYNFRVRCRQASDNRAVMSDWSPVYTAETPAAAPVGMLDVWSVCDSASDQSRCTILWKEMPKQQANGNISSYLVTIKLNNGSELNINESVSASAEACDQCGLDIKKEPFNLVSHAQQSYLPCSRVQEQSSVYYCHLSFPVKKVKGIGVTANTQVGMSSPALVALPRTGLLQSAVELKVREKSQELNVSWSVPPQFSDSVQEYVVQHKPIGLPDTRYLNWVKVPKNQTFVTLRGPMSNYTAYNVSLFAIVKNCSCLLKSAIAYTVEGVPPVVTDFQAIPSSSFSANLKWTPIPLNISQGHIVQYLVGFSNNEVGYNVSSNLSSYQLHHLNPGQQYEVWISAKTSAGEGERATACFSTMYSGNITNIMVIAVILTLIIPLLIFVLHLRCRLQAKVTEWFYKIPDPINSSSFKQMSNQFWHSWPVPSSSMENGLTISQVEIVPEPQVDHGPEVEQPEEHRKHRQSSGKELQGLEQNNSSLRHQKEYSQMIDSSDEDGREDEEWNEQIFPSDYEKHFIPCFVDA